MQPGGKIQSEVSRKIDGFLALMFFLTKSTWMPTLVRLVPCVRPDVLLKVGELGELSLADLATVRLDPEVDPRVLG